MNFINKLKEGLTKTKKGLVDKIFDLVNAYRKNDEEFFEKLEEIFIEADIGVNTSMQLVEDLRNKLAMEKISNKEDIQNTINNQLIAILEDEEESKSHVGDGPLIILVVGVNGVGKTTTIGKLAYNFKSEGKSVLLAAGDTFRAAAIEQLEIWANRAGVAIVKSQEGADSAAVAYDAVQAAIARKIDVVLIDTAGRLQNKVNLMNEIAKIKRVVSKAKENAIQEVLLVLDATTGQNAISQAKVFKSAVDVTGIVLTKLDGTAKGGIIFAIKSELGIPIKYVGIGEKIDDLKPFNSKEFVDALFAKKA